MSTLYVLYEHAAGYGLFFVKEVEEIGALLPEVEKSMSDVSKFKAIVNLSAFQPFRSGADALVNVNSISDGTVHEDLLLFLQTNLPKKKHKYVLGLADARLGAALQEVMDVSINTGGVVNEILRGIRLYFPHLVKGFTSLASMKAQLGLGHSYSRSKVKFNVHRVDNMIIQTIALLDQLDKDINTFTMRIREWYSYHFPELIKIVNDNTLFVKCVQYIKNRKEFTDDMLPGLEEIVMDSAKAKAIVEASKSSMGMEISQIDLINIERFASRVSSLVDYRKNLHAYLEKKMESVAPNLQSLVGNLVGARLISHAGSLTNLAKYPASTVQILGAEKALFRALKTRGRTPKYGLIFHSTFIGRAAAKNKGRISRYLANKCSIASRIDCFADIPTNVFGEELKKQVEDRLKFYDSGEAPKKNVEVMREAITQAEEVRKSVLKKRRKEAKRQKKLAAAAAEESIIEAETTMETEDVDDDNEPSKKKKKKSKKRKLEEESVEEVVEEVIESGKKKKKRNKQSAVDETLDASSAFETSAIEDEELTKSKKKKKKKKETD